MKAAFYSRQGPAAEVLGVGEQPLPQPGPGEVRIRLRTSGVNPSDWKARKGGTGRAGMIAPTIIPHSDGAGDVDIVGAGVSANRIGERVWIWNGQWKRPFGTAAQYVCVPERQAVRLPDVMDYAQGACLGIPAFTAMQAMRLGQIKPGMNVLVAGGAGSVGHYAIQMARARGATVLTTVSNDNKAEHARAAGASHIINYRVEDVAARVRAATDGAGVDVAIEMDITNNAALYPHVLKPRATVVVYGISKPEATVPAAWLMFNSITVKFFLVYEITDDDRRACLAELEPLLATGKLQHTVAQRLPLEEVARAHDIVEAGQVIGNVVLDID